jgi:putative transposase
VDSTRSMTRNTLAPDLQDLDAWPTVDPSALTEARRKLFNRREQAIRRYVAGQSLVVEGATGIKRGQLYQLLARCILRHPDGRIQGFRGLLPHARTRNGSGANGGCE